MALLAIGLLVVGGSAVAMAADPTTSPTPAETTQPTDTETTAPVADGTDATGHRGRGDCPAKDGDGGTAPGSGGTGTTPNADPTPEDTTAPAPSIDASDV